MSEVKLTKSALRREQQRLVELQKYLPTLQLKKAMLQEEVNVARAELNQCLRVYEEKLLLKDLCWPLMQESLPINLTREVRVAKVQKSLENIAGIEVFNLEKVVFDPISYSLFDTPPWVDGLVEGMRQLAEAEVRMEFAQKKKEILEFELKDVSIKVNLFEKRLIPEVQVNIRKIKVFLGDQQLAAISQAKAAKRKIENKKLLIRERQQIQMEVLHAD